MRTMDIFKSTKAALFAALGAAFMAQVASASPATSQPAAATAPKAAQPVIGNKNFVPGSAPNIMVRHLPAKASAKAGVARTSSLAVKPGTPKPAPRLEPRTVLRVGKGATAHGGTFVQMPRSRAPLLVGGKTKNGQTVLECDEPGHGKAAKSHSHAKTSAKTSTKAAAHQH